MHRDRSARLVRSGGAGVTSPLPPIAPVLTKTSAAGHNPMSWSGVYTMLQVGDVVRLSYTQNGGAATTETHTVTSDDLIGASEGSYSFTWTGFVTASGSWANGDVITVKERVERAGINSAYSNILTDTLVIAGVTPGFTQLAAITNSTGAANPYTFSAMAFDAGRVLVWVNVSGGTCTGVDIGGVAATLVLTSSEGRQAWIGASNLPAGNYDIAVHTASTYGTISIMAGAVAGVSSSTPVSTSLLADGTRGAGLIQAGAITLTGGVGVLVMFAVRVGVTNTPLTPSGAVIANDNGDWFSTSALTSGTPGFTTNGSSYTTIMALGFS